MPDQKGNGQTQELNGRQSIVMYLHDLVYMLSVILVLFLLVFRVIVVSGPSMKMTLLDGDYLLLISNMFYRNPQPGDIIVVSKNAFDEGKPIVKRVIAAEGQIVDMDFENGIVYVDGLPLIEPYTNTPTNLDEGNSFPMLIEKGHIFVLGDNRNNSKDSRSVEIGQVDIREVVGKVFCLVMPGTENGNYIRDYSRIGAVK